MVLPHLGSLGMNCLLSNLVDQSYASLSWDEQVCATLCTKSVLTAQLIQRMFPYVLCMIFPGIDTVIFSALASIGDAGYCGFAFFSPFIA